MVRAILEGRKTQTRRTVKPQPRYDLPIKVGPYYPTIFLKDGEEAAGKETFGAYDLEGEWGTKSPYGKPGDRLWIRETCNLSLAKDAVMYLDAGGKLAPSAPAGSESWAREWKTCPSIHMPRWASRITLEITSVRVERLQNISEEDAKAEGLMRGCKDGQLVKFGLSDWPWTDYRKDPREAFENLWRQVSPDSWAANPWVWVIEFKRPSG